MDETQFWLQETARKVDFNEPFNPDGTVKKENLIALQSLRDLQECTEAFWLKYARTVPLIINGHKIPARYEDEDVLVEKKYLHLLPQPQRASDPYFKAIYEDPDATEIYSLYQLYGDEMPEYDLRYEESF